MSKLLRRLVVPAEPEMDPILRGLTRTQALWLGYIVGPLLIGATSVGLYSLIEAIGQFERITYVRPYGILFVFPIMVTALLGGRGPAVLSLALAESALIRILMAPPQPAFIHTPRDWAETTILPLVGAVVILCMDALRNNARWLSESQAAQARTRAIMTSAPVGIATISSRGEIQFANREIERIWGSEDITGHPAHLFAQGRFFTAGNMQVPFDETPLGRVLRGVSLSEVRELLFEKPTETGEPAPPRIWTELRASMVQDEKRRMQGALMVMTDITERKTADIQLRARMQREAVISRISVAIRNADEPEAVQHTAAAALGEALGADRCFFITVDQFDARAVLSKDFHRPGLRSLSGVYSLKSFTQSILDLLVGSSPSVRIQDLEASGISVAARTELAAMKIRSMMIVPICENDMVVSILATAMAFEPRAWTDDEVALAEIVAAQTLTVAEVARLRFKEHRIATILQEALYPSTPVRLPGIDFDWHYSVALEEARIGGDFLDIFALDTAPHPRRFAIAVGDVSGKGLVAATQVATVRTMLRYALTRGDKLEVALEHLNDTLATRDWLVGFATLFIGIFDADEGVLHYASCGHEPALLRRAAGGEIEELGSTGAAMGAYEGAKYETFAIPLHPGDQLLVYTDGLSEAGPNRLQPLGPEGIRDLMSAAPRSHDPIEGTTRHNAGDVLAYLHLKVSNYTGGKLRDDMCLLVIVAQSPEAPPTTRPIAFHLSDNSSNLLN